MGVRAGHEENCLKPMPSRPPSLKPRRAGPKPTGFSMRLSRQARGYGRAHDLMRERVKTEEPLCRACLGLTPARYTPTAIADHIIPKAEGGGDERDNYQGLCRPCHTAKTAREAARGRRRRR